MVEEAGGFGLWCCFFDWGELVEGSFSIRVEEANCS